MTTTRTTGQLTEVGPGVHAYLQKGSWGFSNAGLVADGGASLLVDTLYDLKLTSEMLRAMRRAVPSAARIGTVVNTHANGDHCWGNQLADGAQIVSSKAAAEEMLELKPNAMRALVATASAAARLPRPARGLLALLGRLGVPRLREFAEAGEFVERCFGAFDFGGIRLTLPTRTFEGRLSLTVGDKRVELIEVGPAHTRGDLLVWLPAERVVFTGDILFVGMHPIAWEGPISNWIAACDRLLELDPEVVVPGHGPLTDQAGVRETRAYWDHVLTAAREGRERGASPDEVARAWLDGRDLERGATTASWSEAHRLVVNVDTAYRDLQGDRSRRDPVELFVRMSRLDRLSRS